MVLNARCWSPSPVREVEQHRVQETPRVCSDLIATLILVRGHDPGHMAAPGNGCGVCKRIGARTVSWPGESHLPSLYRLRIPAEDIQPQGVRKRFVDCCLLLVPADDLGHEPAGFEGPHITTGRQPLGSADSPLVGVVVVPAIVGSLRNAIDGRTVGQERQGPAGAAVIRCRRQQGVRVRQGMIGPGESAAPPVVQVVPAIGEGQISSRIVFSMERTSSRGWPPQKLGRISDSRLAVHGRRR